jgi:hypothetical protein
MEKFWHVAMSKSTECESEALDAAAKLAIFILFWYFDRLRWCHIGCRQAYHMHQ